MSRWCGAQHESGSASFGIRSTLPPPASLPAAVRLNDLRIVPSGANQAEFPVLFPRNVEPHRVGFENRRDLGEFLTGGWSHNSKSRRFFRPHFASRPPPAMATLLGRGWATYTRRGEFDAPKGSLKRTGETSFPRGCVTGNGEFGPPVAAPPLRITRGPPRPGRMSARADAGFVFSHGERGKCCCGRSFDRAH